MHGSTGQRVLSGIQVVLFLSIFLGLAPLFVVLLYVDSSPDPDDAVVVTAADLANIAPGTFVRIRGTIRSEVVLDEPEWLRPDPDRRVLRAERTVALRTLVASCVRWRSVGGGRRQCSEERMSLEWLTDAKMPVAPETWSAPQATVDGVPFLQGEAVVEKLDQSFFNLSDVSPLTLAPEDLVDGVQLDIPEGGCFRVDDGPRSTHCVRVPSGTEDGRGDLRVAWSVILDDFEGVVIGEWDGTTIVPFRVGPFSYMRLFVEADDDQIVQDANQNEMLSLTFCGAPGLFCSGVPALLLVLVSAGRRRFDV
jgi:hypothetical protein